MTVFGRRLPFLGIGVAIHRILFVNKLVHQPNLSGSELLRLSTVKRDRKLFLCSLLKCRKDTNYSLAFPPVAMKSFHFRTLLA